MTDPLSFLRQYNISKKAIVERNDQIIFGDYSWSKNAKTNYLVWGSGEEGKPKDYYNLQCLLYFLKTLQLSHPVYVEHARAENIPFVRRPDRKKLLAYLNGETSTSPSIDGSASIEIPNLEIGFDRNNGAKFIKEEKGVEAGEKVLSKEVTNLTNIGFDINNEAKFIKTEKESEAGEKVFSKEVANLISSVKHVIEGQNLQKIIKKPKLEEDEDKRKKDQPTVQLNVPKESSVTTDHIRSLADAMPIEKIAAIKAKHLAKKRSKMKSKDDVQKDYTYIHHILDSSLDVTLTQPSEKQCQAHANMLPNFGKESVQIKSLSTQTLESTLTQMQKCCQTLCDNDPDRERSSSFQRSFYKILKPYRNMLEEKKRNICKTSTSVMPFLSKSKGTIELFNPNDTQ